MLGVPLGSLGIGITIWEPPQEGPGPEGEVSGILQEDGLTNFVLLELDGDHVLQESN